MLVCFLFRFLLCLERLLSEGHFRFLVAGGCVTSFGCLSVVDGWVSVGLGRFELDVGKGARPFVGMCVNRFGTRFVRRHVSMKWRKSYTIFGGWCVHGYW